MPNNDSLLIMERYNLLLNKAVWGSGILTAVKAFWDHTTGTSGLKDKYDLKLILLKDYWNKSSFLWLLTPELQAQNITWHRGLATINGSCDQPGLITLYNFGPKFTWGWKWFCWVCWCFQLDIVHYCMVCRLTKPLEMCDEGYLFSMHHQALWWSITKASDGWLDREDSMQKIMGAFRLAAENATPLNQALLFLLSHRARKKTITSVPRCQPCMLLPQQLDPH